MSIEPVILYKRLAPEEIGPDLLQHFTRYQVTTEVWVKENNQYKTKADSFIDHWDDVKKQQVIRDLQLCAQAGGRVVAAIAAGRIIGFANVESTRFGSSQEYVELPYIHVSNEFRKRGIGAQLFARACAEARELQAKKLYIAAHPSVETQHFYRAVGCTYAAEVNQQIYAREPLDIQMEYVL